MDNMDFEKVYEAAIAKVVRTADSIGASFPHVAVMEDGKYNNEDPLFWTSGFWPGLLYLAYDETHDEKLLEICEAIELKQDDILCGRFELLHHDVGFQWQPMSVAHYDRTGDELSLSRAYRAALILASRYNPSGRFIRAWNDNIYDQRDSSGWAIIDCLMNLSLLYWASVKFHDPRFKEIAANHANTILENSIRPDGSAAHITVFDPVTGEFQEHLRGQGKSPDSSWSRGQGWLIYGMAISYRETGDKSFLEAAENGSRNFMRRLSENLIPYWDFDADEEDSWVMDTSASAIAASGMMEIYKLTGNMEFKEYAARLLSSLIENCLVLDDSSEGLIMNGTVNYTKKKYINVPIIYGDFYFVEALRKYLGKGDGLF